MVEITELNREPASTVSTLTATTEVTSPSVDATDVTSDTVSATTEVTSPSVTTDALEANTLVGADVLNASENQILVAQGDGTLAVEAQAQGPNPYDQVQTFNESDVVVSTTDTQVVDGSIQLLSAIIDNFEDGDTIINNPDYDGWNDSDNVFSAQQSTVLSGSYSGRLSVPQGEVSGARLTPNFSATNGIEFDWLITNDTGDSSTTSSFKLENAVGQSIIAADWNHGGGVVDDAATGAQIYGTWSEGTVYSVGLDFDFVNDETDVYIDGTLESTVPFDGSSSEWAMFQVRTDNRFSTQDTSVIIDGLADRDGTTATSGDVLISWDRGTPTDIFEWDAATFTRTLDGETVDVFVAYSSDGGSTWTRTNSGNPISRNYSLNEDANITPDVDVRIEAELSRADTANNPTLDSAYRSWLV